MRIAHFSDIHVGCWPRGIASFLDKRILGSMNFVLRRRAHLRLDVIAKAAEKLLELAPDRVVFTGDLTSTGTPAEFDLGMALLAPILESFADRFVYVPGNHDAYVTDATCAESLRRCFTTLNGGRWELGDLPAELCADGVCLVVVNECRPTSCWMSSGELTLQDWTDVREKLEAARARGQRPILVSHFPLRKRDGGRYGWRRRLVGAEPVYAALTDGRIDAALCGHDHVPFVRHETGGAIEACAGSLTIHGKIGVLDIVPQTDRIEHRWIDVPRSESTTY